MSALRRCEEAVDRFKHPGGFFGHQLTGKCECARCLGLGQTIEETRAWWADHVKKCPKCAAAQLAAKKAHP